MLFAPLPNGNALQAEICGIEIEDLPDWKLLEEVATKLFGLLDGDGNGYVSREEVVDACLLYDERVPVDGIEDTFEAIVSFCPAVDYEVAGEGLDYDQFYMWCVLMFGDCSSNEFVQGTREFATSLETQLGVEDESDSDDSDDDSDDRPPVLVMHGDGEMDL